MISKNLARVALTVMLTMSAVMLRAERWQLATRLYSDNKARLIGDLLTVQIIEESSNSREASHRTAKQTGISGQLSFTRPRVDNNPTAWTNVTLPEFNASANRSFNGSGAMQNKDQIKATMTVRVVEVLPNNNLLVEGQRSLIVQGEEVGFMLSGTVRPNDINRENIIKSTAISDLTIRYYSSGSIASNQKKGIFGSIIDWVNPF